MADSLDLRQLFDETIAGNDNAKGWCKIVLRSALELDCIAKTQREPLEFTRAFLCPEAFRRFR